MPNNAKSNPPNKNNNSLNKQPQIYHQQKNVSAKHTTSEPEIQEGTFVNIQTGEMRAYFANPPRQDDWRLLSPRIDLTVKEAAEIVTQGGYDPLKPAMLHY